MDNGALATKNSRSGQQSRNLGSPLIRTNWLRSFPWETYHTNQVRFFPPSGRQQAAESLSLPGKHIIALKTTSCRRKQSTRRSSNWFIAKQQNQIFCALLVVSSLLLSLVYKGPVIIQSICIFKIHYNVTKAGSSFYSVFLTVLASYPVLLKLAVPATLFHARVNSMLAC